jgi:cell division protein YceG involved in septum cleavage
MYDKLESIVCQIAVIRSYFLQYKVKLQDTETTHNSAQIDPHYPWNTYKIGGLFNILV